MPELPLAPLRELALHLAILTALGALIAVATRTRVQWRWFAAALGLVALHDALLLRGYGLLPDLIGGEWNWTGKILTTLVIGAIALRQPYGASRVGLTWRQREGSRPAWLAGAALAALFFWLAWRAGDGPDGPETILFQWTMPGIEEELFYRGVLLVALNEAFGTRTLASGAQLGWGGAVMTVSFGLIHALGWREATPSFDAMTFALTAGPSVLLWWFRERTGSLVLPVLAHNVANGASTLI